MGGADQCFLGFHQVPRRSLPVYDGHLGSGSILQPSSSAPPPPCPPTPKPPHIPARRIPAAREVDSALRSAVAGLKTQICRRWGADGPKALGPPAGCLLRSSFLVGRVVLLKQTTAEKNRVPTYSNLLNLEDLREETPDSHARGSTQWAPEMAPW